VKREEEEDWGALNLDESSAVVI